MMEARRENANYFAQIEAGRKLDYIEERQRKRTDKQGGPRREGGGEGDDEDVLQRRDVRFDRRGLLRRMDEQRRLPFSVLLFDCATVQ